MQGYDKFKDMMFPFSELSDIHDIPDQSSIGLMLDELPEIRDMDITAIADSSYKVIPASSTCEIDFASSFGTTSISIPPSSVIRNTGDPPVNWSVLNLLQSVVPAPQPSSFLEPFTGPSCDPTNLSPTDEILKPGARARKRCTHELKVKVVTNQRKSSKKAKTLTYDLTDNDAKSKEGSRVANNAEHVVRERQRRDDMAGKYSILDSMLPSPSSKRERAAIVVDAIMFVKDLQHRKEELLKRCSNMKQLESLRVVRARALGGTFNIKIANEQDHVATKVNVNQFSGRQLFCKATSSYEDQKAAAASSPHTGIHGHDTALSISRFNPMWRRSRPIIQAHRSNDEIHIEVVCSQPRSDFQSLLIQSVESLSLEVRYCSISTLLPQQFMQCVVTAKPVRAHAQAEIQSSARIIDALQAALEHVEH